MSTTLALVKKEQLKKPEESALQYADRTEGEAFLKLHRKQKRTKDEENEYKERVAEGYYNQMLLLGVCVHKHAC